MLQVYRREKVQGRTWVEAELCNGCKHCVYLGCPAISYQNAKASIDPLLCVNCGICGQVCPQAAMVTEG